MPGLRTMGKNKKIKTEVTLKSGKNVITAERPNSYYNTNPIWSFSKCDFDHEEWGINRNAGDLLKVIKKLNVFESMTWGQIYSDTSGRKNAPKNNDKSINTICREAQKSLLNLNLDNLDDTITSLTIDGSTRLWGIRDNATFYIIWIDPNHSVYPVEKSHT